MEIDIVDTETASLKGGVCDIAIVRIDENFNVLWEVESLIDPEMPISAGAGGVHGIRDEMVHTAPTLVEFMDMHDHPLDRPDMIIGGHNIQFDCRMLSSVLPQQYRKLCTLRLAKLFWPDNEDHRLQTLIYQFRLRAGTAHRAMGDVIGALSLLKYMAEEQETDLTGLLDLSQRPLSLDSRIGFGKHKGMKLREIPMGWVNWLLGQPDVDPDLREALSARI